jgi:hypothetical protein
MPHDYPLEQRTIGRVLADKAQRIPQRTFLLWQGRAYTYAELDVMTSRYANGFAALGIGHGDHVAVMLPNCPEFLLGGVGSGQDRRGRGAAEHRGQGRDAALLRRSVRFELRGRSTTNGPSGVSCGRAAAGQGAHLSSPGLRPGVGTAVGRGRPGLHGCCRSTRLVSSDEQRRRPMEQRAARRHAADHLHVGHHRGRRRA